MRSNDIVVSYNKHLLDKDWLEWLAKTNSCNLNQFYFLQHTKKNNPSKYSTHKKKI